jgi:hypothetical protein
MKRAIRRINYLIAAVALCILFNWSIAFATFTLSYTLTEGNVRMEMDSASPEKGVTLSVNSSLGCVYQIFHSTIQPLVNRDNPSAVIRDNFMVRGIRGSNRYGNFYIPTHDVPFRENELLYTSDSAGDSDQITLVYGISNLDSLPPGGYQGQIAFTLRPVGVAAQEVVQYLYVYVKVDPKTMAQPVIEIIPVSGTKIIRLSPRNSDVNFCDVEVNFNGDFNKLFNISQFMPQGIESTSGDRIDNSLINVEVKKAKRGMGIGKTALSYQPLDLYTSGPNGEKDDSFLITYFLGDFSKQKAGRYTSRIQYILDQTGSASRVLETLELQIENEKIFDIDVSPENQKGTLEFLDLKPGELPKKSEVVIQVKTNAGKQYQVMQKIYSDLTDKEGNTIPSGNFKVRIEQLDKSLGIAKATENIPVEKGDMVLYISDSNGSPDKFKIIYELTCPQEAKAGDYSTRIAYSLLEV